MITHILLGLIILILLIPYIAEGVGQALTCGEELKTVFTPWLVFGSIFGSIYLLR